MRQLALGICIGVPIGFWLAVLAVSLIMRWRDRTAVQVPQLIVRGMYDSEMDDLNAQIRAQYNEQGERTHCSLGHTLIFR